MPTLSQFYGVTIQMYFRESEHNPPHIHAMYSGFTAEYNIDNNTLVDGEVPKRIEKLIQTWIGEHREELLEVWETQDFKKITPLL